VTRLAGPVLILVLTFLTTGPLWAQAVNIPEGFKMERGDRLVHIASGTSFPAKMAGFIRTFESTPSPGGSTGIVSYRKVIAGEPVAARIAVTHIEGLNAKEHFLALKTLVGKYFNDLPFTDIVATTDGPLIYPRVEDGHAYQGHFTANHAEKPYELSLSTVDFGYWDVRLTAAYPTADAYKARASLRRLADAIAKGWPSKK
jgi:hypothetical protein